MLLTTEPLSSVSFFYLFSLSVLFTVRLCVISRDTRVPASWITCSPNLQLLVCCVLANWVDKLVIIVFKVQL